MPDSLKKYVDIFTKGVAIYSAPGIAKGMLLELLRKRKVSVYTLSELVNNRTDLWNLAGEYYQEMGRRLAVRVGNLDWITPEWVVESLKDEYPSIASLFIGWKKAANWLEKQTTLIRDNLQSNEQAG